MAAQQPTMDEVAREVRAALESADLTAFSHLLDPDVHWGAPDDAAPGCTNRQQVLTWYRRGRARGVRASVTELVVGGDKLLVGLKVVGNPAMAESGGQVQRWQVLTVAAGRIVDIRGFEDRADAAARLGPAPDGVAPEPLTTT
jgi:ketosteroid isomerase-like protein